MPRLPVFFTFPFFLISSRNCSPPPASFSRNNSGKKEGNGEMQGGRGAFFCSASPSPPPPLPAFRTNAYARRTHSQEEGEEREYKVLLPPSLARKMQKLHQTIDCNYAQKRTPEMELGNPFLFSGGMPRCALEGKKSAKFGI